MSEWMLLGLAEITLVSSAAIALIYLMRPLVRRHLGPHSTYALWLLVPISALAVLVPARVAAPVSDGAVRAEPAGISASELGPSLEAVSGIEPTSPPQIMAEAASVDLSGPWMEGLLMLWLIGVALSLIWFAVQHRRAYARFHPVAATQEARVFRSERTDHGPAVVGVLQPKIVIPADFEARFMPEEQRLILSHERAHLKAGDTRINMAVCALRSVFWFNPLIHLAAHSIRQDQEVVRDADALATHPGQEAVYSKALLSAQTQQSSFMPSGCTWTATHPLVARVAQISAHRRHPRRRHMGYGAVAAACLAGSTGAWALQPPQAASLLASSVLFEHVGTYGPPQRFQAASLSLQTAARVNLIFEDRTDIDIQSAADGAPPLIEVVGAQLRVGQPVAEACEPGVPAGGQADLIIRVPEALDVSLASTSQTRVAGSALGRLELHDCAQAGLGSVSTPARLIANDQARLSIEHLAADSTIVMADASTLQIGAVDGALVLDQLGASQALLGTVQTPLEATVAGASRLDLQSMDTTLAELLVVGASGVSIGTGRVETLDLKVLGSSTAHIAAAISEAEISASGSADIVVDTVARWSVMSRPDDDGRLQINGVTQPP